jgi:hypothetical protein
MQRIGIIIAAMFLVSAMAKTHEQHFVPRARAPMPEINVP